MRLRIPAVGFTYAMLCVSLATAAPLPEEAARSTGILVLDDCDEKYDGKEKYEDNLTMFGVYGRRKFRASGLNNCQSIGSNRMIATDPKRQCVWAVENVAHRIRRFDLTGKETFSIRDVNASAIAVDPETGDVWTLVDKGGIGTGDTIVYSQEGKIAAKYEVAGWDIVYDAKAKAFWIAGKDLTKISVASGAVSLSTPVAVWSASSLDVDPTSGGVWVAVREHDQILGSDNLLLKFDADGKEQVAIALEQKIPFRVSVDPADGSVWVANLRTSVDRYSSAGKLLATVEVEALAVQVAPEGGAAWVVTPTETVKVSTKGLVKQRVPHAGKTGQAWIAAFE